MEQVNQSIAYKLPDAALSIIKKVDVKSGDEVYSVNIVNEDLVFVTNEIVDQRIESINGQELILCAGDLNLRSKMFDAVYHEKDKTLEGRKVFVKRDERIDCEKQTQNGMNVLTTFQSQSGGVMSHNMVVLDGGKIPSVEAFVKNVQRCLSDIVNNQNETNKIKAAAEAGFLNGALKLIQTLKLIFVLAKSKQ